MFKQKSPYFIRSLKIYYQLYAELVKSVPVPTESHTRWDILTIMPTGNALGVQPGIRFFQHPIPARHQPRHGVIHHIIRPWPLTGEDSRKGLLLPFEPDSVRCPQGFAPRHPPALAVAWRFSNRHCGQVSATVARLRRVRQEHAGYSR